MRIHPKVQCSRTVLLYGGVNNALGAAFHELVCVGVAKFEPLVLTGGSVENFYCFFFK